MKHNTVKMRKSHRRYSWSKLPSKVIFKISKRLKTREDVIHCRAVCSKWRRRSIPYPEQLLSFNIPLPYHLPRTVNDIPFHHSTSPLTLQVSSIYLITPIRKNNQPASLVSFKPWMVMAEESHSGKVTVRHSLTKKQVRNTPPCLDMSIFQTSLLAEGYTFKGLNCILKVLLCSASASFVEVMVLYNGGRIGMLTLGESGGGVPSGDSDSEEEEISHCWRRLEVRKGRKFFFSYLDDVVEYKGWVCAADRKGKLYRLDTELMSVAELLVNEPICNGELTSTRRKRLVVDLMLDGLYLVVRENLRVQQKVRFKVYKFNEQQKRWDVVENLGHERVLFVGIDHCFFGKAKDFPGCGGNCVVFAANCFTKQTGCNAPDKYLFPDEDIEVGVYKLGVGDNFSLLSSAYSEFSQFIWPPPTWFFTKREDEEDAQADISSQQSSDKVSLSSFISLSDNHAEELLSDSSSDSILNNDHNAEMQSGSDNDDDNAAIDGEEEDEMQFDSHNADKDYDEEMQSHCHQDDCNFSNDDHEDMKEAQTSSFRKPLQLSDANLPDKTGPIASEPVAKKQTMEKPLALTQMNKEAIDVLEEKAFGSGSNLMTPSTPIAKEFQGLSIRPELLPTLETIWAKRGNLIGEHTVRSKKMLACALEELAELINTLNNTTVRTLTESQADNFRSSVLDLGRQGLKVDWLETVIEKALAVQRSKPFLESIMTLEKEKAKLEEEERAFLARSAEKKRKLDESREILSARIPFPVERIDLDGGLGDGLF